MLQTTEKSNKTQNMTPKTTPNTNVVAAIMAAMPLSIAVIPWGILCGTLSIEVGLNSWQAQLMSLLVFAGAAQLAGVTIFGAAGSWMSLLNSTTMISVRHLLYSAAYKDDVTQLPLWKRVLFAFLLTDEMFAVAKVEQAKTGRFDYWYAVIAGGTFYVIWNLATFAGIFFANSLDNIGEMGFDFAIVATFIAMIIPMIKLELASVDATQYDKLKVFTHPLLVAVMVSAVMAMVFAYLQVGQGLIFSTLIGMAVGAYLNRHNVSPIEEEQADTSVKVNENTPVTESQKVSKEQDND